MIGCLASRCFECLFNAVRWCLLVGALIMIRIHYGSSRDLPNSWLAVSSAGLLASATTCTVVVSRMNLDHSYDDHRHHGGVDDPDGDYVRGMLFGSDVCGILLMLWSGVLSNSTVLSPSSSSRVLLMLASCTQGATSAAPAAAAIGFLQLAGLRHVCWT